MKWKIFSTGIVLAAALGFVSSADAQPTRRSRYAQQQQQDACASSSSIGKGPGYGLAEGEMNMGYSAPARINCTCSWDMFLSGSFIYWLGAQEQMDVASWQTGDAVPARGIVNQKQKFEPGFKVALGTTFGHDDWMGSVEYTRMHFSTSVSTVPPTNAGSGLRAQVGWVDSSLVDTPINSLNAKWKCNLDVIDGELTRWYYSGRMLTFGPFFGPRGGWLKQRMTYTTATVAAPTVNLTNTTKSSAWFIGPRTGMDASWILGWGFRMIGSAAGALLYERQSVSASYTDTATNAVAQKLQDTYRLIRPNAEVIMGLGWGTYLMDNSWHIDIAATYDFHYWWGQNAMRSSGLRNEFNLPNAAVSTPSGDLSYQGLTLTLKVDF